MQKLGFWLLVCILLVVSLMLLAGGAVLVFDGGSVYYLAAGILVSASAVALVKRNGAALKLYAALLIATLAWSLWEVGFDGWALAPRLLGPAVLGGCPRRIGRLDNRDHQTLRQGVERTFAWLGRCRRLAKDWETTIASSAAWATIASIRMLTRRTARYCYA